MHSHSSFVGLFEMLFLSKHATNCRDFIIINSRIRKENEKKKNEKRKNSHIHFKPLRRKINEQEKKWKSQSILTTNLR